MRRLPKSQISTRFTADVYRAAAEEHWTSLQTLYEREHYCLALYTAGLAVECMFRAYRVRIDPEFDSRHVLIELARGAKFALVVPESRVQEYAAALGTISLRWSSNHRFRSSAAVRAWLKRLGLDRGIRGDILKENARRAIAAAGTIVTVGVGRWKIS